MRQAFTTLIFIATAAIAFTGCVVVHDEPPVVNHPPHVDVHYEYWTGARNVEVDGEIYNDGPGFATSVELEFRFYNEFGEWVDTQYRSYHTDLHPGHSMAFFADFRYSYIYEIEVSVAGVGF